MVEEKQKRVDSARRALRLLRTACIVWPNSASEVLLAGSFDGWASKVWFHLKLVRNVTTMNVLNKRSRRFMLFDAFLFNFCYSY